MSNKFGISIYSPTSQRVRPSLNGKVSFGVDSKREKSVTNYLLGEPLKDVDNFKDLGVTITKDLSCTLPH